MMATSAREVATAVEFSERWVGWGGPADRSGRRVGWPDSRCSLNRRRFPCTAWHQESTPRGRTSSRNRSHVAGADVDHFVVNAKAVPQVNAVLEQLVGAHESSGFEMMICSILVNWHCQIPRSLWPWLRPHGGLGTPRPSVCLRMVSSMYIAVRGCLDVAIM